MVSCQGKSFISYVFFPLEQKRHPIYCNIKTIDSGVKLGHIELCYSYFDSTHMGYRVAAMASLEKLLEKQNLRPYSTPTESEHAFYKILG